MKLTLILLACGVFGSDALRSASTDTGMERSSVHALVNNLIADEGSVRFSHVVAEISKQISFDQAASSLRKRHQEMPKEVSSLLVKTNQTLSEDSLSKARVFLNGLIVAAYVELDAKIIEAKEFELQNRGTWQQVVADISRLGAQIADHMRRMSEATACIEEQKRQIEIVKAKLEVERKAYITQYNIDYADMQIKQNDLDVFNFLIKTTKDLCDEQKTGLLLDVGTQSKMQICDTHDGATLRFSDLAIQEKFDRMMMKGTKNILNNALMRSKPSLSLLQEDEQKSSQPAKGARKAPVASGPIKDLIGQGMRCGPVPDCGLLYDTLSLEWGGYKDQVDELKKKMDDNAADWNELKSSFEAQISSLTDALTACEAQLSEATADKIKDGLKLDQKEEEKRELDHEHKLKMEEFRKRIKYIFNQDICGPTVIRNRVMKESEICSPDQIDDCDVTPWTPEVCSVDCDDNCPAKDEVTGKECGGVQNLKRDVVAFDNHCGIVCPPLNNTRKCNQIKCPVDCLMSEWSGWSKCSKECESGVEVRTRSILTRPKNGGRGCSAVSDTRSCNTGSCDRDCSLEEWSTWSPCSMACDGGDQSRVRNVDIPIRGQGKCPRRDSIGIRLEYQTCNVLPCIGDEICIAKQDLILNIDGSGSVNKENFALVRNFTGELLKRYKSLYFGDEAVYIGVVEFGNGAIEADGTISKAIKVRGLGFTKAEETELKDKTALEREEFRKVKVTTAVKDMTHQAGFTNMAQGFVLADKMLTQHQRMGAQPAVMTISDGMPSFKWETEEKAEALKQKGVMLFMVAIAERTGQNADAVDFMKHLTTKPTRTNFVRVPGFDALQDGGGPFVDRAITKFCPAAMSPSQTVAAEKSKGWMLVYKEGYCGWLGRALSHDTVDPQLCKNLADQVGATGFSMGRRYRKGACYVETLSFTCANYEQWQDSREDPECLGTSESNNGKFHDSRFYDWYAIEPTCPDASTTNR